METVANYQHGAEPGRGRWVVAGAILVTALVLNQSAVHWREDIVDSHYYAYCGWRVADGAIPYLDIWNNKPPLTWWVNAAGYHLCGEGVLREVLICSLSLSASLGAFMCCAVMLYGRNMAVPAALVAGVLLTDVRFDAGANRTEPFVVTCELLAVCAYLWWLRRGGAAWLLLGAIAAGAAPLFKQSGLGAAAACGTHLLVTQILTWWRAQTSQRAVWRKLSIAAAGFVLPTIVTGAVLASRGALREAWFAIGPFNETYFDADDATWWRIWDALYAYREVLDPLLWVLLLAGMGVTSICADAWRSTGSAATNVPRASHRVVIALWAIYAVYLACVGPGRQGHHFLPALSPIGLLLLDPLWRLARGRHWGEILVARGSVVVAALLWAGVLGGVEAGNLKAVTRFWDDKSAWYGLGYAQPKGYQLQADAIRDLAGPDDPIYVWGWSPGTYRYAYRHAASRFATLEKLGQLGPQRAGFILESARKDIRAVCPRVFVISESDLQGFRQTRNTEFVSWFFRHYRAFGEVGGMFVYVWNDG